MTKSRPFSRNSARNALSLILSLFFAAGCSTSTLPTYEKRDLDITIEKILRDEYKTEAVVRLVGSTLFAFIPVETLFEKTSGKDPRDRVKERFEIEENESLLRNGLLRVSYLVRPVVPEREKDQGYKLNKQAVEKIGYVWEAMRRVIFSMDRSERDEVHFYVLIAGDITNGLELRETIYYQDLIKVLYQVISPGEYHHRVPYKTGVLPEIIGDREGKNIDYKDVLFSDFLCTQIEHRIGLKFQRPEVGQEADLDREIRKIVLDTLNIYGFSDFQVAELTNLLTNISVHLDSGDLRELKSFRK